MENDKYVVATASGWVNVTAKTVVPISVDDVSVVYGENATVVVTGLGNIVGDVITINVTGKGSQTVVVNASGMANATFAGLGAGVYEIVAIYAGNETYAANSTAASLTVVKASSDVIIGVNSTYYVDDTIVVNITRVNSTGAVTVKINGKVYAVVGNNVTIPNGLANGTYIVDVVLAGDDNYNGSAKNTTFVVNKLTPSMVVTNITVGVGGDAVINVTGPVDRNATLVVRVDDVNYAVNMTNGNATLTVKGLGAGNYTVVVTYMENDKYVVATASGWVNVTDKGSSAIIIGVDPIYKVGDKIVINLTAVNSTGQITVTINGKLYNVTGNKVIIDNGLEAGEYLINAILACDEKYTGSNSTKAFSVVKNNITVTLDATTPIVVDSPVTFTAKLNESVTGDVIFTINGANYTVHIVDKNNATYVYTPVNNQTLTVVATFVGNDKYTGNFSDVKHFVVNKVPTHLSISIDKTSMSVDDKAVVSVVLDQSINNVVTVKVNGKDYIVGIVNGKGNLTLSGLSKGNYTINAVFAGDDKYSDSISNNVTLNVTGKTDTKMSVDIDVENGTVTVGLPAGTTGNVTVVIDGKVYNVTDVTVKPVIIDIGQLIPGNHTIEVIYSGDDNFTPASNITYVEVPKIDDYEITVVAEVNGSSVDITVNLPTNITGPVLIDVNGVGYYANATGGQAKLHLDDLSKGKYDVFAYYPGNEYYAPKGNTTSFNIDKKETPISIKVGEDEIVIELPDDAAGNVTASIDGKNQTVPITGGKAIVDISDLEPGQHTIDVTYPGDDNYNPASNSTTFEVPKISDYPINITKEDNNLVVNVPDDATGNVTVAIDGKEYTAPIIGGKAVVDISDLEPGKHSVEVTYSGDEKYAPGSNATIIEIPKIVDYPFEVIAEDINVGEKTNITVNLPNDVNGQVLVDIDGIGYYANVTNGVAHVNLPINLKPGTYEAVVTFPGNDKYVSKTVKDSFTVDSKETPMSIVVEDDDIIIELPKDATGSVIVSINGKTQTVSIKDGRAVVDISDLEPGNYTVVANYPGDSKYPPVSNSTTFEVPKIDNYPMNMTNTDNELTINVPNDATGNVKVTIDGKTQTVPIKDGKAVVDISNLPVGSHDVEVTYPGNDKYASKTINGTIVKERSVILTAPDVVKYYHGLERFVVYVTDDKGNKLSGLDIKITINGQTYTRTSENGEVSIPLGLISSNYTVKVVFEGNDQFKPQSVNATVEILPTIYAKDVFKVFRNGTQYYAFFVDSKGNPLVNTDVSFNINGVFYARTTNSSGWAKLNINLPVGEYILTAVNPVTTEMRTNKVTVITLIESSDLVKYYRNDSQFIARIHSDDGGWAKAGEEITFNINGIFYTKTTNETGHVKLNINLPPGDYIITSSYKGCKESNNIKVLPVLVTSDLVMKYHDGSQFVAKTLDGQGNPAPHKEVSFNINGILYSRLTNDVGEAAITVNLQPGEYIITSQYGQESNSNKITIEE